MNEWVGVRIKLLKLEDGCTYLRDWSMGVLMSLPHVGFLNRAASAAF